MVDYRDELYVYDSLVDAADVAGYVDEWSFLDWDRAATESEGKESTVRTNETAYLST